MITRFQEKENIGNLTNRKLKQKIETLTGRQIAEIEKELFDFRKETVPGLSIEDLQKLASLLILFSNGVLPDDTTEDEYRGDRWHIATKLLEKGAGNLNGCVAGLTPLHTAVRKGSLEIVRLLFRRLSNWETSTKTLWNCS